MKFERKIIDGRSRRGTKSVHIVVLTACRPISAIKIHAII